MTLIPYYPVRTLHRELNRLLSEWPSRNIAWHPSVDVQETAEAFIVTAELPGVNSDDVRIQVENNMLIISGEKKQEERVEEDRYFRIERAYGTFQRSFKLPSTVDADRINATYKDGVLTIHLPKAEAARPKEIPISVGA